MHDVENEPRVVGYVDLPIFVRPNLLGMVFKKIPDEPRHFNAKLSVVVSFYCHRSGNVALGA
jgi:hypothetical protein